MEIVRPADVLVHRQCAWRGGGQALLAVQPALEDGGHTLEIGRTDRHCTGAGCLQPRWRVLMRQALHPQTSSVTLLGVRTVFQLPGHHGCRAHADAQPPVDELLRCPLQMRPVRRGHMVWRGGVPAALVAQGMTGHTLVAGEAFHQGGGDAQLDGRANQGVGHAVVMAFKFDVVVDIDLGRLPAKDLKAFGR